MKVFTKILLCLGLCGTVGCINQKDLFYDDVRVSCHVAGKDSMAYLLEITDFNRDASFTLCNADGVLLPFHDFTNRGKVAEFCSGPVRKRPWLLCPEHGEPTWPVHWEEPRPEVFSFRCIHCGTDVVSRGMIYRAGNPKSVGCEFYFDGDNLRKVMIFTSPYRLTTLGLGIISDKNPTGTPLFLHWPIPEADIRAIFGEPDKVEENFYL